MFSRHVRRSLFVSAIVSVLSLLGHSSAHAQSTYVWNLDANGTWDTVTNNWSGAGSSWTNGPNTAIFGNIITANRAISVVAGGITAGNITFDKTGLFAYSIGTAGNTITLNSGGASDTLNVNSGTVGGSVYNSASSTASNTLTGSPVVFANNLIVNNNGAFGTSTLRVAGAINRAVAGGSITFNGQSNSFVDGSIGSTVTGGVIKNDSGSVTLAGTTNAFTGGITINGGVLAINANDAMLGDAANGVTINGGGTFRYNSTVTTAATHTFTINGSAANPSRIDMASGITATFNGVLSGGASSVLKLTETNGTGVSIFSVESANAGYTGSIIVGGNGAELVGHTLAQRAFISTNAATLRLANAGTLQNASSITVNTGGALTVTQPTTATTGRLGAVPITLNNGRFQYNSNTNGGLAITDSAGVVTIRGTSILSGSSVAGTTGGTSVTLAGLNIVDKAALWVRGPATGTGAIGGTPGTGPVNYFVTGFSALPNLGTPQAGVLPFAANTTSVTGTDPVNLVTYDANGIRPLTAAEAVAATTSALFLGAANSNVNLQTTATMAGNLTINSLFNSTGTPTINGSGILTVTSGTVSTFLTMSINGPTLNFGSATGYFLLGFPVQIQGTSSITGTNGVSVNGLAASSQYQLRLTNTVANTFTGGLFINGNSQVTFLTNNQLGNDGGGNNAGSITMGGGQLLFSPASATTVSLNDGANNRNISVNAGNGTIGTTVANAVLQIPGTISGPGQLQFGGGITSLATGVVELTNPSANTYTGGTVVSTGILRLSNSNQLGTGTVFLNGGTLQASGALTFANAPILTANTIIDTQANTVSLNGGYNSSGGTAGTSAGSMTLTKNGTGTLVIAGPSNHAGTLALPANMGVVTISGGGQLRDLSSLTIASGSRVNIDNSGSYDANRISDAGGVTLSGGLLNYISPSAATSDPAELFGVLTVSAVNSVLNIDGSGATSSTILRFRSLNISSGNITFRGTNLGDVAGNVAHLFFNTAPVADGQVIPNAFFVGTSGTTTSTTPAAYSFTRGVIAFTPPPFSGTVLDNYAPSNVSNVAAFTTTGNAVANTGVQVYSLTLDGGSTLTVNDGVNGPDAINNNTPTGTVRLAGGFLTSQNGAKTIQPGSGASTKIVDFGGATGSVVTTSDLTIANGLTVTGSGGLVKTGAGGLNINGAYNLTGATSANAGTMNIGAAATIGAGVNLGAGGTGILNLNATATYPTLTGSAGGVINQNAVGATIGNASIASGSALNINGNTTVSTGISGTGNLVLAGGTVTNFTGATPTLDAITSGGGGISYTPAAVNLMTITGNNSFAGGVTTNANSRFIVNDPNAFGTGTVDLSLQSASSGFSTPTVGFNFGAGGTGTVPNNMVLSQVTGTTGIDLFFIARTNINQTITLNGVISSGTFSGSSKNRFVVDETGTSHSNAIILANPANTFIADLRTDFGTLGVASNGALGDAANVIIFNNGLIPARGSLMLAANGVNITHNITATGAGSSINTNGNNGTISGVISGGAATLTKMGAGTLILSNTNTYTGATSVAGGRLDVNGSIGSGAVTVNSGATLGGTGTINGPVTINSGGNLAGSVTMLGNVTANGNVSPGNSPGILTLAGAATLAFGATGNYTVEIQSFSGSPVAGVDYDQIVMSSFFTTTTIDPAATLTGVRLGGFTAPFLSAFTILNNPTGAVSGTFAGMPNLSTFGFDGQTFQIAYNVGTFNVTPAGIQITSGGGSIVIAAVPEPATVAFMVASGLGTAGFLGYRRWRNKKNRFARAK